MENETPIIKSIKKWKYFKPLCYINENEILVYKAFKMYTWNTFENTMKYSGKLDGALWKKVLSHVRFINRVLRLEPRCCIMIKKSIFLIAFAGGLHEFNLKNGTSEKVYQFREGMNHAQMLCQNQGNVYFGDYLSNPFKEEIYVYKYCTKSKQVQIIYTFEKGMVNHIHEILWDKQRRRYWIFTGDVRDAAAIWYTDDEFRTVVKFFWWKSVIPFMCCFYSG